MSEDWGHLTFTVPAMSVDIFTKNKLTGKRVRKLGENGQVMSAERIIPKERPRFSTKNKVAYSATNTTNFESWIRKKFFETYPGTCGVYYKKKPLPTHSVFLGCRWYHEDVPCTRYRRGADFLDCQVCAYRRKNLVLHLRVFLKDERHLDLDNVVKVVLDALEKVCFFNDSQFVRKQVELFPYAESERLEISLSVLPVFFSNGSLVGGYSINKLSVDDASDYINNFKNQFLIGKDVIGDLVSYLLRCDSRKFIKTLPVVLQGISETPHA